MARSGDEDASFVDADVPPQIISKGGRDLVLRVRVPGSVSIASLSRAASFSLYASFLTAEAIPPLGEFVYIDTLDPPGHLSRCQSREGRAWPKRQNCRAKVVGKAR